MNWAKFGMKVVSQKMQCKFKIPNCRSSIFFHKSTNLFFLISTTTLKWIIFCKNKYLNKELKKICYTVCAVHCIVLVDKKTLLQPAPDWSIRNLSKVSNWPLTWSNVFFINQKYATMTVKQIFFREITIFAAKSNDILINFQLISYPFLPNCFLILKQDFLNKNNINSILCIKLAV